MADYITCAIKDLSPEALASALLTKNSSGEFAVRVMFVDACSDDAIDCSNNSFSKEHNHKMSIGISECGKPALRLALPRGSFLNDIESFADDAAAAAGSVPVGAIYYNTTNSRLHVRMS
jgi:hypothetical protein